MANRGEEKVWVQMNVVPRSTVVRVVPCFPLLGLTPSGLFVGETSPALKEINHGNPSLYTSYPVSVGHLFSVVITTWNI